MSVLFGRPYHGEVTSSVANEVIEILRENHLTFKEIETVLEIVEFQVDCAMRRVQPELEFFVLQK